MQSAKEALRLLQAGSRREQVAGARAAVAGARAALAQIEARATDLVLTAPVGGIVLSRNAEPGEALGAGVPVLTLGEMARAFVRVYLPQSVASGLAIGAAALVLTGDGRVLPGRVVAINPRAEFTPRVALTESERADLMFGVKVEFENPAAAPYPGLWVTVRVAEARGKEATRQGDEPATGVRDRHPRAAEGVSRRCGVGGARPRGPPGGDLRAARAQWQWQDHHHSDAHRSDRAHFGLGHRRRGGRGTLARAGAAADRIHVAALRVVQ